MSVSFDDCVLVGIINPNVHCTQINYVAKYDPHIPEKALILFDQQIQFIEIEDHVTLRRVKVHVRGEDEPINIDFPANEVELYDLFLRSLYNK
jgi:hypothetical protein